MLRLFSRAVAVLLLTALLSAGAVQSKQEALSQQQADCSSTRQAIFGSNNIKLWPQVLRIAGVEDKICAPPARYAALLPTDAAFSSFLHQMGLNMTSLAARPQLAKQLVAQHLVLALPPNAQQALTEGRLTSVPTAAATPGDNTNHALLRVSLTKDPKQQLQQQLRITDSQGQTAASVKVVRQDANKVAIIIDKVLRSGHYYPDFASLCKYRSTQAGPMCEALTKSGVLTDPSNPAWPNTLFIPGPKAFQQAGIQVPGATGGSSSSSSSSRPLSQGQLTELVKYHVVPGLHAFPEGFTSGASYGTLLPGASLKVEYSGNPFKVIQSDSDTLVAYVIPANGQRVPVVVYNVFVGQGVAQGIPAVLMPPGFQVENTAQAGSIGKPQAAAAPSTTEEKGQSAASSNKGRKLLGPGVDLPTKVTVPFNTAETEIRAATRSMFKEAEDNWA